MNSRDGRAPSIKTARFSTEGLDEGAQFDGWREQLGPRFGIADVSRPASGPFQGSIETRSVGLLSMTEIAADPMTFERARIHVERRERDEYTLGLLLSGAGLVEQDGRAALLTPGDLVLCDSRRPYRVHFDEPFRQIVFHCDRAQFEARLPDAER